MSERISLVNYRRLLFTLYRSDEKLSLYNNVNIKKVIANIKNQLIIHDDAFYNMESDKASQYWSGDSTNHWEIDDYSYDKMDWPVEDVFNDEQESIFGFFDHVAYERYYSFSSERNSRIQLLKIIHRMIITLNFYQPYGYFIPFNVSEKEIKKVYKMNNMALAFLKEINYQNNQSPEGVLFPVPTFSYTDAIKMSLNFDNNAIIYTRKNKNIKSLESEKIKQDSNVYLDEI